MGSLNNRNVVPTVLETGPRRSRSQLIWFLVGLWFADGHCLAIASPHTSSVLADGESPPDPAHTHTHTHHTHTLSLSLSP